MRLSAADHHAAAPPGGVHPINVAWVYSTSSGTPDLAGLFPAPCAPLEAIVPVSSFRCVVCGGDPPRHECIHVIHYPVPPTEWEARDLEAIAMLVSAVLPSSGPLERDICALVPDGFGRGEPLRALCRYRLQVARGDCTAQLLLPQFSIVALAEWLATRPGDISLWFPLPTMADVVRGITAVGGVQ
jgi:hypothetical protein